MMEKAFETIKDLAMVKGGASYLVGELIKEKHKLSPRAQEQFDELVELLDAKEDLI